MRTSLNTSTCQKSTNDTSLLIISILSILQSIISMTNSIVKNDNAKMALSQFKQHHKRFSSTKEFLKHSISRASHVLYPIGLLLLKWTVCQGTIFSIVCVFEILLLTFISSTAQTNVAGICCYTISLQ